VQILVYASPVMYPIAYLPPWAQRLVFLNPFTQIMQDARALVLYPDKPSNRITVSHALGHYGRLAPIGITAMILLVGVTLFRRQQAWMAEGA